MCHPFGPYQTNLDPKTSSVTSEAVKFEAYNHRLGPAGQLNLRIAGKVCRKITFARKHKVVKMFPESIVIKSYGLMKSFRK